VVPAGDDRRHVSAVARRGLRLATACAVAALVPETLHGAEDVRAGVGHVLALIALDSACAIFALAPACRRAGTR
jgi:hypothetical protein